MYFQWQSDECKNVELFINASKNVWWIVFLEKVDCKKGTLRRSDILLNLNGILVFSVDVLSEMFLELEETLAFWARKREKQKHFSWILFSFDFLIYIIVDCFHFHSLKWSYSCIWKNSFYTRITKETYLIKCSLQTEVEF